MRALTVRGYQGGDILRIGDASPLVVWAEDMIKPPAYTLTGDCGEIVACCGVQPIFPHSGEAWVVFSEPGRSYVAAPGACRRVLEDIVSTYRFSRVQASVRADNERDIRFVEWLGFSREGLLRRYGPEGADYLMYARIYTWHS
jgi:RimJ/RimL family protein N-acetyltransferase